jgi:hypothetical protein
VLIVDSLGLHLFGLVGVGALDGWEPAVRGGLTVMLVLTASAHFASRREELIAMVPRRLPAPARWSVPPASSSWRSPPACSSPRAHRSQQRPCASCSSPCSLPTSRAARARLTLGGRPVSRLPVRAAIQAVFVAAAVVGI